MKNLATLLLVLSCMLTQAQDKKTDDTKDEKGKRKFHVHNFEFQFTPSADYFIYAKGRQSFDSDPYDTYLPFIGGNIGGQYMFRPIHLVSVSGGLMYRMQGGLRRTTDAPLLGDQYISSRSYGHVGYLSIPIYVHLYKKMKNCTFEFATGPEFAIPVFATNFYKTYNPNGDVTSSSSSLAKKSISDMKQQATFGWSIFLGGELPVSDGADFFIGPQIHFLNLANFNKNLQLARTDNGGFYQFSFGLKFGFRFHKKS